MRMNIHSDYHHRFLGKDWKWSARSSLEDNLLNVDMAVFHLTLLFGYTGFSWPSYIKIKINELGLNGTMIILIFDFVCVVLMLLYRPRIHELSNAGLRVSILSTGLSTLGPITPFGCLKEIFERLNRINLNHITGKKFVFVKDRWFDNNSTMHGLSAITGVSSSNWFPLS